MILKHEFIAMFTPKMYKTPGPLLYRNTLFVCEAEVPPKYKNMSGIAVQ
jgi:hypothetical protein